MKILLLMIRYNGLPSVLVGFSTALVMAALFSCGLLPGINRGDVSNTHHWSTWSLGSGFTATLITFFLWRPQQLVFLDRICISKDRRKKTASILSLAGILQRSDEMLVLWDATWGDRLWCVFELAAFLKSKDANEQVLLIRPTFLGPCSIVLFVGVFIGVLPLTITPILASAPFLHVFGSLLFLAIAGYFIAAAFRAYFRSVETFEGEVGEHQLRRHQMLL